MTVRLPRTWILVGTLLVGAAARIAPLFHDFWLDEAWSYLLVRDLVVHPIDILTKLSTDNNHPLNSLTISLFGTSADWPVYRLPAWVAGVLCIPLSGIVMRRFGTRHSLYAMLLVACSYPLIVYSTEARGYSTMVFCVLLAIESVARWLSTRGWISCAMFWMAVILGFLSHLTFIQAYIAILLFSVYELRRSSTSWASCLTGFLACHSVPLLFLAALYWLFIRRIAVAGAEPTRLIDVLVESITMTLGGPNRGPIAVVYVIGFLVLLFMGLSRMQRRSPGWHWLFFCGIVLVPLSMIISARIMAPTTTPVFPRYFLTSMTLFLLLTGFLLGELHEQYGRRRVLCAGLLALILAGNVLHLIRFSVKGRGHYLQALQFIGEHSSSGPIHLASNSDFRTSLLLSYYSQYVPKEWHFVFHSRGAVEAPERVDWLILEFLEPQPQIPPELNTEMGTFSLQRSFDFYGPSGCGWALYQRSNRSG